MRAFRNLATFLFVATALFTPSTAVAQTSEPTISHSYGPNSVAGPGRAIELIVSIDNTTDAPVVVNGTSIIDVLDVTADGLNHCPREWWGDAAYADRPRGEDEQNPPVPPYPLPAISFQVPLTLQPGEVHTFDYMYLYMIEAAPNQCQSRDLRPVYMVDWQFAQTYGTVSGQVTDVDSGLPIDAATVTITGVTDAGIMTEDVAVDANGFYVSQTLYQTGTEMTATASAPAYDSASHSIVVEQGDVNVVNLALSPTIITGSVAGTVTKNDSGDPVPNAIVTITGTDAAGEPATETLTTDENGEYAGTAALLVDTSATVIAEADGFVSASVTVDAIVEGVNTANVLLASNPVPLANVFGVVTDSVTGTPLGGVTVTVTGVDGAGNPVSEKVTTNNQGAYSSTLEFAVGSDVSVTASMDGYESGSTTVTIDQEGTQVINLALAQVVEGEQPTPVPTEPFEPTQPVAPMEPADPTAEPTGTPPPVETETPASTEVVSQLPSTGSGPAKSFPWLIVATIALASLTVAGARRLQN